MSDTNPQPGRFRLYRGRQLHISQAEYDDASRAVHMDAAGAYLARDRFMVLSRDLPAPLQGQPDRTIRIPVEPLQGATASSTAGSGSPMQNEEFLFNDTVVEVEHGNDTFMAITQRGIWRRELSGSWELVYDLNTENPSGLNFQRIRYAAGTWLVAQGGNNDTQGVVLRSVDDGDNWASTTLAGVGRITFMERGPGSHWMLGAWRGLGGISESTIYRSLDSGATWSGPRQEGAGAVFADGVYFNDRDIFIIQEYPATGYGLADASVGYTGNDFFEAYWRWALNGPLGAPQSTQNLFRTHQLARRVAMSSNNDVVVVSSDGRVSTVTLGVRGDIRQVSRIAGMSSETGGAVRVNDLAYDPVGNAFIAVGGFTPDGEAAEARAWRSTDNGLSWTRLGDVERAMLTPIVSLAMDGQGNALYLSSSRWAFSGTRRGLEGGEYNIYVVSYFNTHAGKFVYDMHYTTLTTEDGGSISFSAPDKAAILAANQYRYDDDLGEWVGWITPEYEPILDDLRFDVYIQATGEPILGEEVIYTIRYAFTESFPEEGEAIDRTIDALPLGRQLILHGEPTTAVFEKRHTALHNGRIWGMAAQDEERWPTADVASPEIANQHQRFVLSYSEVGWANLISDRSFVVIQPTQSTRFTGILSTPSGLLVMFENEIHLVTGDPAFGNVSVELYLDLVGHDPPADDDDPGPQPCKVGGVPFVIWNGKLWVLQAGQAQQIGQEQWLRNDPFKRISPEPQTRSLLALTESGSVFRYMLDDQFWLTDPMTRNGEANEVQELLTNCACETGDNTRFMLADGGLWSTRTDVGQGGEGPDSPHVYYRDIDFAALDSRTSLYLVKVGLEGYILEGEYDRDSIGFDPDLIPALFYAAANEFNGALDIVDPLAAGGLIPYIRQNNRRSNTVTWRLPLARTRGSSLDVRLELRGFDYEDVLKLPVQLIFSRGGVVR